MPPPTVEDRLLDVQEVLGEIDDMLKGISFERFEADMMLRMATERCLEILCKAARRLPDEVRKGAQGIDWRRINDFANLLRHAYHATNVDVVWNIVQDHLPPLKAFVELRVRAFSK
jgi:uncharacterized protein with HEPN domain